MSNDTQPDETVQVVTNPETGERMYHYEWSGWLWCENEMEAFDWETGEVECPHCGAVFEVDEPSGVVQ